MAKSSPDSPAAPGAPPGWSRAAALPLWTRLRYAAVVFMIQFIFNAPAVLVSDVLQYWFPSPERPDFVRAYPARRDLPIRVFIPSADPASTGPTPRPLPTLFTIHGGGFVVGRPHDNDAWNRSFASRCGVLVIALNYRKAPAHRFPTAVHDLAGLVSLCLADASLPIDRSQGIALAGWSAGGTLALALAQLLRRNGNDVPLRAVLPMYPALDLAVPVARKEAARRRKPVLGGARARDADVTASIAPIFDWAYIPAGADRRDPLLSPLYGVEIGAYAGLDIFMVACELDRLANEAWRMVSQLGGRPVPTTDDPVGRQEPAGEGQLIFDDERFAFEVKNQSGDRCRWLLVPDTIHGYDSPPDKDLDDVQMLKDARMKMETVIDVVGKWLLE